MNKILRIDVGKKSGPEFRIDSLGEYSGLGGRALTSSIINKEVPPDCHPLGKDNKLVIAPGILSGTIAVMSGRLSIGCKSPLTGTIKESNAGGQAAQVLAKMGYAAIVFEGTPENNNLYKVYIDMSGVKILSADELKGLGNYDLIDKLVNDYGKNISCISIGQAGEMKMSAASIACTDMETRPTRHAGRGGVGAVMGSKNIKAIVMKDENLAFRQPSDIDGFKSANKIFANGLRKHSVTGEGLPTYGTNVLTNVLNEAGAYPTKNFSIGSFSESVKISGEALANLENSRGGEGSATHGCHKGCIIKCSGTFFDKDGKYVTKQPEYETVWAHGGNCCINNLDIIAKLDRMDDDFGLDTIEMGATIAVAMEAGIIDFGDGHGAISLLSEVGKATPLGRVLGNGAAVTGQVFGVERVPVVKRQAMPAYDPRAVNGIGVTYATSPMGADHTAGYAVTANILGVGGNVDPLKSDGQVELSRNLQIATAAIDSTGMCLFIAFAILDQPETFESLMSLLSSFFGKKFTADDFLSIGKSVLKNELDFNRRAGFVSLDDRLPPYFKKEKLEPHNVIFKVSSKDLDSVFSSF